MTHRNLDADIDDPFRPEPPLPPPALTEYILGAVLYGVLVLVDAVWRWRR